MSLLLRVLKTREYPQEGAEEMEMRLMSCKRGGMSDYLQNYRTWSYPESMCAALRI